MKRTTIMKKALAILLAVSGTASLCACGSSSSSTTASSAASTAGSASTAEAVSTAEAAATDSTAAEDTETSDPAAAGSGTSYEGHTLYVANWQGYNSDADYCEKAFEDMTGCEVEHVYYNSYDELMTTLMTGGNATIDAVVLGNNYTQWFHDEDLIMNVDPSLIPNYADVADTYKDINPYAVDDDGNVFAFPWCNGTSSLAYNPDKIDFEIEHWSDLLRPELTGHVMVMDGDGDDWILGCLLAGEDSDDLASADIDKVRDSLMELKGQLLGFWTSNDEQTMPWLSGDFWAGEIWSGPYSQLLDDDSTNIKLVHPEEGTLGYIDYWAIVNGTDEFDLACEWINWIESYDEQYAMATGISEDYPGDYSTYTPVNAKVIDGLTEDQKVRLELDPMPTKIKLLPYVSDQNVKDEWEDLYQEFVS